jgi:hypothetical protein
VATVRYRVEDIPANWADAWFPMPTLTPAGATSVRWTIYGAWGTEDVPLPNNRPGSLSRNPAWKPPSAVAPDYFRPQLAVQDIRRLGPPVSYLPQGKPVAQLVPPVTPIGQRGPLGPSAVHMGGRKVGGRRSMFWPRVFARWPNLTGSYNGAG